MAVPSISNRSRAASQRVGPQTSAVGPHNVLVNRDDSYPPIPLWDSNAQRHFTVVVYHDPFRRFGRPWKHPDVLLYIRTSSI